MRILEPEGAGDLNPAHNARMRRQLFKGDGEVAHSAKGALQRVSHHDAGLFLNTANDEIAGIADVANRMPVQRLGQLIAASLQSRFQARRIRVLRQAVKAGH